MHGGAQGTLQTGAFVEPHTGKLFGQNIELGLVLIQYAAKRRDVSRDGSRLRLRIDIIQVALGFLELGLVFLDEGKVLVQKKVLLAALHVLGMSLNLRHLEVHLRVFSQIVDFVRNDLLAVKRRAKQYANGNHGDRGQRSDTHRDGQICKELHNGLVFFGAAHVEPCTVRPQNAQAINFPLRNLNTEPTKLPNHRFILEVTQPFREFIQLII